MNKQWISADRKKDSVFIFEDIIYYGRLASLKDRQTFNQHEITNRFTSIPFSYLKEIQIDRNKKVTTLAYGKADSTLAIRWDNPFFMDEFSTFLSGKFPHSQMFSSEESRSVKGPVNALIIIPILYFIVLIIGAFPSNHSSNRKSDAIIALFQALASLGSVTVTVLFFMLFLIALLAYFRATKKSSQLTIIRFR